ncbi:hypothetical protein PUN71_022560 [Arthrobacter sp. NQ7]|uniref:hypothetical protein n=1 Tax=Arthrobacter sp. NQ7 TaxID=3032303 RepID=UPI00240ECF67|nr:hypothetical protein [Arthrobacter sp. NQ7]MDJ0459995.1 hypothetical protein [Arthrobacter sp. NQ7]
MKTTDSNLERHIRLLIDAWFGLANAAAGCTRTYLDALPENRMAKGILARSIFEFGITCVWLTLRGAEGFDVGPHKDRAGTST